MVLLWYYNGIIIGGIAVDLPWNYEGVKKHKKEIFALIVIFSQKIVADIKIIVYLCTW